MKVYIIIKTQSSWQFGDLVADIGPIFTDRKQAKAYVDDKNSRATYMKYSVKTKEVQT